MPRKKRQESPTGVYHWIVRGTNKKDLFHKSQDFDFFIQLMKEYKTQFVIGIYHYCLMTNHVHLLIKAPDIRSLSGFSHYVQRRYAYYYSKAYGWRGNVFQERYRIFSIDKDSYLLECARYIERNPLKAGLVTELQHYPYSSFRDYIGIHSSGVVASSPGFIALSHDQNERRLLYRRYVSETRIQEEMVAKGLTVI